MLGPYYYNYQITLSITSILINILRATKTSPQTRLSADTFYAYIFIVIVHSGLKKHVTELTSTYRTNGACYVS